MRSVFDVEISSLQSGAIHYLRKKKLIRRHGYNFDKLGQAQLVPG